MDENEITRRLRDAGEHSVPGEVRSTHLHQMQAAAPVAERTKRFGRLAVAAAAFVGFALGSTGFAMAGALPDPAQQVAHDVLSVVQVDVEDPKNRGQCISAAARNNTDETAKAAAKAECPKGGKGKGRPEGAGPPDGTGNGKGRPDHAGTPGGPNGTPHDGDPCKGPPPWAGKAGKALTPEQKAAAQAARAACPGAEAEEPEDVEIEEGPEPQDQAPPAEQRQADPAAPAPDGTPPAPPAGEAPGTQDGPATPPVETPAPGAPDAAPGEG